MGNLILASSSKTSPLILAAASKSSSSDTYLLVIVVLVVLFYFVLIRPQSKRRRQVMEQQRQAQPGQRVRTTAGMYATVVAVEDDDVILEVAPGVHSRFVKRAIMEVLPDGGPDDTVDGTGYAGEPFTDEEAPAAEDTVEDAPTDTEPGDTHDDAPAHEDGDITAHLGEESPNGSSAAAQDETRATDSV